MQEKRSTLPLSDCPTVFLAPRRRAWCMGHGATSRFEVYSSHSCVSGALLLASMKSEE